MGFWSKFAQIAKVAAPLTAFIPGIPPSLPALIERGVVIAEGTGLPGADKKAIAMQEVENGITALNQARGEIVVDPAVLTGAVSQGIDATVATINAIKAAHAEDQLEMTATPPPIPPAPVVTK